MCGFIIRFLTIFEIVIADFQVKLKMKLKHVILVYCTDLAFIIVKGPVHKKKNFVFGYRPYRVVMS